MPLVIFQFLVLDFAINFQGLIIWSIACGLVNSSAYLAYYKALEIGPVSIVSSAVSGWLGVCVLISVIFFGESTTLAQVGCMVLILAGIILLSQTTNKGEIIGSALGWSILAMVILGWVLAALPQLSDSAGIFLPVFILKFFGGIGALVILRTTKIPITLPHGRSIWLIIVLVGSIDSAGFIFFAMGVIFLPVVVVAPIVAAHPMATVILAYMIFRERLRTIQWVGVMVTLSAVITLSALYG